MDYEALQMIAKDILNAANQQNILSKVYWYSPESRKLRPNSKIGYYETKPTGVKFSHGCKLIIVFPRLAFDSLEAIINKHLPRTNQIAYQKDHQSSDAVGFDVYQRIQTLKLFIEPDQKESKTYNIEQMLKQGTYWNERQLLAFQQQEPPLTTHEILKKMNEVSIRLKQALGYLQRQDNPQAKLRITRLSGVRHRMVRVNAADDQSSRAGFSDLVIVFSGSKYLPEVVLPKEPNPNRKPRSDSISAQYRANRFNFNYYDKFGIFEVYDK